MAINKQMEQEAHLFACLLLMPKELLEKELEKPIDLGSDKDINNLAKLFQVPLTALVYRISVLKQYNI